MQILKDNQKARREINLHWQASVCPQIVPIIDVYENVIDNQHCLLVVMEWCVHYSLLSSPRLNPCSMQ